VKGLYCAPWVVENAVETRKGRQECHGVRGAKDFQKLVGRIRGTPEERPIAALMLRTMQKARYDAVSLGHFGLAKWRVPIRRFFCR